MRAQLKKRGPGRFLEGHDSAGTQSLRERAQNAHGLGQELEDEAPDYSVKGFVAGNLSYIGLREAHIMLACLIYTLSGTRN
jgi:hypothetical protein